MKAKKKVFTRLAVLMLLFMAAAAMAPTASADWDYYRAIEIDNGKVSGSVDLSSFPVLINHTADWLKYDNTLGHVRRADGYDIVFTNADNSSLLDFEIEKYDGTAGTLVAWVRIPTLDYNDNTTIRLYYGNSAASDWSNATGVWDANYTGVWHLLGDGTTSLPDATSNSNTGTKLTAGPANTASGQIDGAQVFAGVVDDYVDCGDIAAFTTPFSVGGWFKWDSFTDPGALVRRQSPNKGWMLYTGTGQRIYFFVYGLSPTYVAGPVIELNKWYHIVGTYTGDALKIYVNNIEYSLNTTGTPIISSANCEIARYESEKYLDGTTDEVRISATARSGDWINTSHNNQDSPSTFYSVKDTATPTEGTDPVPELPTIILLAVGLVVLAGYVWLRGKNK